EHVPSYIESTKNLRSYSLEGFNTYVKAERDVNEALGYARADYDGIDNEMERFQRTANQSITGWIGIALLVGAVVAAGTIWQVQRHFSEMRRSVLETQRERTFATQLLEGMVSAVAAIDNDDRIRSANAAFFRIFPNASIGA